MIPVTFFVPSNTSILFCLARKVPKEHTAIQERAFLSALLPPERLLVLDHGGYENIVFRASLEATRDGRSAKSRVSDLLGRRFSFAYFSYEKEKYKSILKNYSLSSQTKTLLPSAFFSTAAIPITLYPAST
jgi:hypothetical protein